MIYLLYITQIYSGITRGRVLEGELLHTKSLEVNLFAFAYSVIYLLSMFTYLFIYYFTISKRLIKLACKQLGQFTCSSF